MAGRNFDDDTLSTVVGRKSVLSTLSTGTCRRRDLAEELDVSRSTCHRVVWSLEEAGVLERTDDGYSLTTFGEVVERRLTEFERAVTAAERLEPLLAASESAAVDIDVELFEDATVTRPRPDDPSPRMNRYLELYRDADSIQTVDRTSFIPPLYVEKIFELAFEDNKEGSAIYPRSVVENRLSEYPEIHQKAAMVHEPMYRICEGVPFGLTLYDDEHVGLRAYDDSTGALLLFADTDDPAAIAWARGVYDHYYEQSEPLSAFDGFPDWVYEEG